MEVLSSLVFVSIVLLSAKAAEEDSHILLTLGTTSPVQKTKCGEYGYFKVRFDHACDNLNIFVKREKGEPNLYVSREPYKFPTYKSLAWSSYEWGSENLTISSWDPNFKPGVFYIAVHSYCGSDVSTGSTDAQFTVRAKNCAHSHPNTEDEFNKTVAGVVEANMYKYYRFCIPSECYKVEVRLENCISNIDCPESYSWPELIISPKEENPTEKSMAWLLAVYEHRSITLDMSDKNVRPGHFYIGVYGWCTPDNKCHDKSQCGPCQYAKQTHFNLSVIPTDTCIAYTDSTSAVSPSLLILVPQLAFLLITLVVLREY